MALRYLTTVAALLQYAHAQDSQSRIVPQDLQTGFNGGATQVQVSYDNRAVDGFEDGTQFEKNGKLSTKTYNLSSNVCQLSHKSLLSPLAILQASHLHYSSQ